jgi:hypothetical protein
VFFRARKTQKMANTVLPQVAPLMAMITRFGGGITPAQLAKDRYLLGFFCGNIGLEMQRAGSASLDHVQKGNVMFLVLGGVFGSEHINPKEIGDLLSRVPKPDADFIRGTEIAAKIQYASLGRHRLHDDPDYLAAKQTLTTAGETVNDASIGGEMLRVHYFNYVLEHYRAAR